MKIIGAISCCLLMAVAGCGGSSEVKKDEAPAPKPHQAAKRDVPEPSGPQLAPEAETPKAKVLGADATKGCTWLQSEATVTAGELDSRNQIRDAAISEAEKNAMQDFLGVEVKSRFMLFQQEGMRQETGLADSLLQTTRLGRILDEKVLGEGFLDIPGCPACRFRLRLKTCIVPIADNADKDFKAELDISRTRFVDGDEAKLKVTTNRDCFIYIYDVDPEKNTSLVVPNDIVGQVQLKAGQTWEYPNEDVRRRGVKLVAQLPEAHKVSAETIRLIASKTPLPMKMEDPAVGGYLSLLRRLNGSHIEWTEDAQAFTIYDH